MDNAVKESFFVDSRHNLVGIDIAELAYRLCNKGWRVVSTTEFRYSDLIVLYMGQSTQSLLSQMSIN